MDDIDFQIACVFATRQVIDAMVKQDVYKEDLSLFLEDYLPKIGTVRQDKPFVEGLVRIGLEVMSMVSQELYTIAPHIELLRYGNAYAGYEMGSFTHVNQVFYWKYSSEKIYIYKKKPIWWNKHENIFKSVK